MDRTDSGDCLGFKSVIAVCFWTRGWPDAAVDVDSAAFGGHRDGIINKGSDFFFVYGRANGHIHHGSLCRT